MYGDRRLVKDREIRTRGDEYLLEQLEQYVRMSGKQKRVVLREWIEEGLQRDMQQLLNSTQIEAKQ